MTGISTSDLPRLAQQIAEALGNPWTISAARRFNGGPINAYEHPHYQYMQGEGDERLELYFVSGSNMQRLTVSGRYPITARGDFISAPHGMRRPDITVAISRSPDAIAREVARRLLPEYRKVLAVVQEIKRRMDGSEDVQEANLNVLAEAFGMKPSADNLKQGSMRLRLPIGGAHGNLEVFDQSVNLNLRSIPIKKALQMARLLMESEQLEEEGKSPSRKESS
ncbi:MAG: hypothetical protein WA672_16035 [Candidatus Angelobacter sp.]